jgi:parallel beta-helix repeat protein
MHLDRPMLTRVHLTGDTFRREYSVLITHQYLAFILNIYRVGLWNTSGVPITNNVVYNTYQSGIVISGQNNIIDHNLVSTVYWSGTAQPQYAEFNINNDGAIMSKDATNVVMMVCCTD